MVSVRSLLHGLPAEQRTCIATLSKRSTHDPVESPCRGSAVPDRTGQRTRALVDAEKISGAYRVLTSSAMDEFALEFQGDIVHV